MKICSQICLIFSALFSLVANAMATEVWYGAAKQGNVLQGQIPGVSKIVIEEQTYQADEDGNFLIAFGREAKAKQNVELILTDGTVKNVVWKIAPTQWDIQKINGLPQKKVTPSAEDQAAINDERSQVSKSLSADLRQGYWKNGFVEPLKGRISGAFGGQRVMNGRKMNSHAGVDIAAPLGTDVVAAGDGKVVMTASNLFYSGNMITIDHGYGLQTMYAHLNKIKVKNGQMVKKGEVIAEVGQTGRVTGPHLHWGAAIKGVRFNPHSLLQLKGGENQHSVSSRDFTN